MLKGLTVTQVWAHRGASGYAPENTMAAFELAVSMGANGIELDLQRSADGRLVVCHDETIDRTSNGRGAIVEMTFDELRQHDFNCGIAGIEPLRIPLLEEVFELIRPTGISINVELKDSEEPYPGLDIQARALAEKMGVADRVLYSSFNHYTLQTLHRSAPDVPFGVLFGDTHVDPWDYAAKLGAVAIHPYFRSLIDPDAVARSHDLGLAVNVWTVNHDADLRQMFARGVDAVITNYPDRAIRIREEYRA